MTTALISVRKLDANHDTVGGGGQADFLTDIYAVAQIIQTSLLLFQGEWWEDLTQGFPLFQQILGVSGVGQKPQLVVLLIQQVILNVPFVNSISDVQTSYNSATRIFMYQCTVETQFGTIVVRYVPGAGAIITP